MDHVTTKILPSPDGSNCSHPTRCHRCGTPSTARPYRAKKGCTGLTQLELSRPARDRKQLRLLIHASRLPQSEFAQYVLGVDDATVYRYLHGAAIPRAKAILLRNIVECKRDGNHLHVVIRTCAERPRWNAMLHRRDRQSAS